MQAFTPRRSVSTSTVLSLMVIAAACSGEMANEPLGLADTTPGWAAADIAPQQNDTSAGPVADVQAPAPDVAPPEADTAAPVIDAAPRTPDVPDAPDVTEPPVEDAGPVEDSAPVEEVAEEVGPAVICGDGLCDLSETCEGCAQDCPLCRPSPGEVIVTEVMQNPLAVTDEFGEWLELHNLSDAALSLHGLWIGDNGSDSHLIDEALIIEPGGYVVLGASADLGVGLSADYVWSGMYLGNAADAIRLEVEGVLIDAIDYDGGPAWPDPTGASMALDLLALDATSNDDGARWCEGLVVYAGGDLGTPGAPNLVCGELPPSVCGDGVCAEDETCESCEVDCGTCPCVEGMMFDCQGECVIESAWGDGTCDAALDCLAHGFDGGDCLDEGCGATLFFSEYVEGSSNNKAVEIYNPTGLPIALSDYAIWKITNGGFWTDEDLKISQLEGTLEPGEVFVACHTGLSQQPALDGVCDLVTGGNPTNFNGDDALALAYQGVIIDVVGDEGDDPGSGWEMSGTPDATKDHTLVRAPSVTTGAVDWLSAVPTWQILETDHFSDLGTHTVAVPCPIQPSSN